MRLRKARSTGSIFAVALAAATLALVGAPTLSAAKKAVKVVAPQISKVETSGTKVTVSGRVTLPENTPSERRRTRVQLTLSNGGSAIERRTVKISAKRAFKASWSTKLSGSLTLTVRVTIKGKDAGKAVKRTLVITERSTCKQGPRRPAERRPVPTFRCFCLVGRCSETSTHPPPTRTTRRSRQAPMEV